jgi:Tol biopolymer transport system component
LAIGLLAAALPVSASPRPGTTTRVSLAAGGGQPNGDSRNAVISADGRYAAFTSKASNLTPGGAATPQVYRVNVSTHRTELVSVGLKGLPGICPPTSPTPPASPSISADGRYVVFSSCATNLVPGDTNLGTDVFVRDMVRGVTTRVSVTSTGAQTAVGSTSQSSAQAISADGRFVAFTSDAYNLVAGAQPRLIGPAFSDFDVFVHDRTTGRTELQTVSATGERGHQHESSSVAGTGLLAPATCPQNNDNYAGPTISADGRYVAYNSTLDGIVASANDGTMNVYVRDRKTGRPRLVNLTVTGVKSSSGLTTCGTQSSSISPNGRFVSYVSSDKQIVPSDTVQGANVYVFDQTSGRTTRVSVTSDGEQYEPTPQHINQSSWQSPGQQLSPDGRYVIFQGILPGQLAYSALPVGGRYQEWATYIYDRVTGALELISVNNAGAPANQGSEGGSTADGRRVLFWTGADNLSSGTQAATPLPRIDVFLRDRGVNLGVGGLAGAGKLQVQGAPSFMTTGLVGAAPDSHRASAAEADATLIGATLSYRPQANDLFVRAQLKAMPPLTAQPISSMASPLYGFDLTASGVHYQVRVQRLLPSAFDSQGGASFGLFRQGEGGLWSPVTTLRGGYGTTGQEIVFSLPLRDIGLQSGGRLEALKAFTATGSYATGPARTIDTIALSE